MFLNDNRVNWQIDCDYVIGDKNCVILSSPTGSGKTKRYENWALNKKERPIFITSPIKSLSNQRYRELSEQGYKVGLETGDIKYMPHQDCDIICCTQEIYNNKYRGLDNTTLIVDEFSYIFDAEERTRVYIDSLLYSKSKNIMICSATFGNPNEVKEYIERLTNREFFLYENKDRLTTLEYIGNLDRKNIKDSLVVSYSKHSCHTIAKMIYDDRINKIQDVISKLSAFYDPRTKNKQEIMKIAKKYNIDNRELIELSTIGVVYYYGSLFPKEKLFIEELFEKKLIDTVVGTDALALGVNFPIQNVVFTQLHKSVGGNKGLISKNLFEQLSGRAGRKGYFDNGYVYYCNIFANSSINDEARSLKDNFLQLVNACNEEVKISLNANIKNILMEKSTIDEEAEFVVKYSTTIKSLEEEKLKITKIINYIKSLDITLCYLTKRYNLDFTQGYEKALENCSQTQIEEIEKISNSLIHLQPYFDKDIGMVYLEEFSVELNCMIFIDILLETPIKELIKKYGSDFRQLLLLRNYMYKLPEKYSKCYDLSLIDFEIDMLDYTVLHPSETTKKVLATEKKETKKNIKSNSKIVNVCPRYLEKIKIKDKEYVKILTEGSSILICDYNIEGILNLFYVPLNTVYTLEGFIKEEKILDILNRINVNSLQHSNNEVINKLIAMKVALNEKMLSEKTKKSSYKKVRKKHSK